MADSTSSSSAKSAANKAKLAKKLSPEGLAYSAGEKIGKGARNAVKPKGKVSGKNPNQVLVAEFLICFVVLGAGTIVAPQGSKDGIPRLMARGTGLCVLFLILSLASATNPKIAKGAAGLGALVTVTYLFTSSDATNVFRWASKFFSREGVLGTDFGIGGAFGGTANEGAAGAVGDTIGSGAELIGTAYGGGLGGDAGAAAGANPPANPGGGNKEGLL